MRFSIGKVVALALVAALLVAVLPAAARAGPHCGDEGLWLQILGAGGPELNDGSAGPSYLLWIDNRARLLVDAGPGTAARYDAAGADFEDLEAIAFTQLSAHHAADLPALLEGSRYAERHQRLPVLGPDGRDGVPSLRTFVERLIGPLGAYPHLADFLKPRPQAGYRLGLRNVPATGRRRWSGFGSDNLGLAAVPVHHGATPTLAWRVEAQGKSVVFAGDFSNQKDLVADFAANADALVVTHALPEEARGDARDLYLVPGQIGRIAAKADVRVLILSHRMIRTLGRESQSRAVIEAAYTGPVIFANDLECWGL